MPWKEPDSFSDPFEDGGGTTQIELFGTTQGSVITELAEAFQTLSEQQAYGLNEASIEQSETRLIIAVDETVSRLITTTNPEISAPQRELISLLLVSAFSEIMQDEQITQLTQHLPDGFNLNELQRLFSGQSPIIVGRLDRLLPNGYDRSKLPAFTTLLAVFDQITALRKRLFDFETTTTHNRLIVSIEPLGDTYAAADLANAVLEFFFWKTAVETDRRYKEEAHGLRNPKGAWFFLNREQDEKPGVWFTKDGTGLLRSALPHFLRPEN